MSPMTEKQENIPQINLYAHTLAMADQRTTPVLHLQCNSVQNEYQLQRDLLLARALKSVIQLW